MAPPSKVVGVDKTISGIKKDLETVKKDSAKSLKALTEGVYKALSSQAEKVTAKRPNKPGKFAGNKNYRPSGAPMKAFVPKAGGGTDNSQTVEQFFKKTQQAQAEISQKDQGIVARRKQRQKITRFRRKAEIEAQIQRTEQRIDALYQKEIKKTLGVKRRSYKLRAYKATKRRTQERIARLQKSIAKKQADLAALAAQYKGENKRTRRKPPKKFKFVNKIGSNKGTAKPQFNEIFRIGGYPRPKSWGTGNAKSGGFFNNFLRHQWRTTTDGMMQNSVFIGPGKPDFNDNQRFLRLLEEGGSMMGGPLYEGYRVIFKNVGRYTHVTFVRMRRAAKKAVRIQPRRFVKRTLDRIKRKLSTNKLNQLSPGDWRKLGSGI